MAHHTPHLTDNDIASLLERTVSDEQRGELLQHLGSCKECFELYRSAAVDHGLDASGAAELDVPADLLEAARRIGGQASEGHGRSSRRLAYGLAAVFAVVVVAGMLWVSLRGRSGGGALDVALVSPVRTVVETASSWGPFVLPGGEGFTPAEGSPMRSGYVPGNEPFRNSMRYMYDTYQATGSAESARWLASGYLATGQIDLARDVVRDALTAHPNDANLLSLSGLLFMIEGETDASLASLEAAHDAAPSDAAIAINLAIVLGEAGRSADARQVLDSIDRARLSPGLATRLETVSADL